MGCSRKKKTGRGYGISILVAYRNSIPASGTGNFQGLIKNEVKIFILLNGGDVGGHVQNFEGKFKIA